MSEEKYEESVKLGFSGLAIISIVILGICVMTGNLWVIAGGIVITFPILIGCHAAVHSGRWD